MLVSRDAASHPQVPGVNVKRVKRSSDTHKTAGQLKNQTCRWQLHLWAFISHKWKLTFTMKSCTEMFMAAFSQPWKTANSLDVLRGEMLEMVAHPFHRVLPSSHREQTMHKATRPNL